MNCNVITELLNIKYPIIQGGMAWIADASLAVGVSEAGGLGIISGVGPTEVVRAQIRKAKELTDKPFGVNVMLMQDNADEIAHLVCDEKVPVVTTGAGSPGKYIEMWKSHGIKVIPVVPQVVDEVNIPVIAAGGIGDGRGIAASFMLGAVGVQMGTRFLVSNECNVHKNYKEKVLKAKDIETEVTGTSTSHPVRVLRNKLTREYIKIEKSNSNSEKLESLTRGALRKAVIEGDTENGSVMAGQIAGLVKKEQSCKEIIEELMTEFDKCINYK